MTTSHLLTLWAITLLPAGQDGLPLREIMLLARPQALATEPIILKSLGITGSLHVSGLHMRWTRRRLSVLVTESSSRRHSIPGGAAECRSMGLTYTRLSERLLWAQASNRRSIWIVGYRLRARSLRS